MTVSAYIGEKFTTTHENQAFNELYRRLSVEWQESDEEIILLGNFFCEGNELDCAVLKKDSINVVDFKKFGGQLTITENGPWLADGVAVRGGSKANPLAQIKGNKFALLKYLKNTFLLKNRIIWGTYQDYFCFHNSIKVDCSNLPDKVASWFHITDMERAVETISNITSRQIKLSTEELEKIPNFLNLESYRIPESNHATKETSSLSVEISSNAQPAKEKSEYYVGKVKWFGGFNQNTGEDNDYGFISSDEDDDLFVHKKAIKMRMNLMREI